MNANKWKKAREGYAKLLGLYTVEFIEAMELGDNVRKLWCTDQIDRLTKAYCWQLHKEMKKNETRNQK